MSPSSVLPSAPLMPSAIHVIHVAPVFGVFVATWRQSRCQHSGPAGSGANSLLPCCWNVLKYIYFSYLLTFLNPFLYFFFSYYKILKPTQVVEISPSTNYLYKTTWTWNFKYEAITSFDKIGWFDRLVMFPKTFRDMREIDNTFIKQIFCSDFFVVLKLLIPIE